MVKSRKNSRLITRNFRGLGASSVDTKSSTVTRLGLRLAAALGATLLNYISCIREISQSFVQFRSEVNRAVYLKPSSDIQLPNGKIYKAVKPFYGMPESVLNWFVTYSK